MKAADKDARHAEWLLERGWPDEFARSEPRTIVIERPPTPPPEAKTPKGMERWLTPKGEGIPLDTESLNYLDSLRQHLGHPSGDATDQLGHRLLLLPLF